MRVLIANYTFNKSAKQITFTDYASIVLENVLLVTDVTNQTTIYQANDSTKGGTVSGNVLTLAYDVTGSSFANTDKLQIFYEVADTAVTIPVSGTFYQSVQPVSASALPLPSGASTETTLSALNTKVPTSVAKNTQGATGVPTQDLKDAGRTTISFYANAVASGATGVETAITLTKSAGTAATTTGASFVITSGKTFRINQIILGTRGNATATTQITTFNLRLNTAGAVTTTSTPVLLAAVSATPATASAWDRNVINFPEGFEIQGNGTVQFGITAASTFVTNAPTWYVNIIGYEY